MERTVTYEDIRYEVRGETAWITINRPEVLNAVRWQTGQELHDAFGAAECDDAVRFIVLTGEGRAFCAGDDVKQVFLASDRDERMNQLMLRGYRSRWVPEGENILGCEKPTIAAVNGVAAGSGMDLALSCDIRIASENARFGSFFVRRGQAGGVASTYFLPRIVGLSRAYELLLTGKMIDAQEAERIGLVSRLVPAEQIVPAVEELIDELSYGAPLAQRLMKRLVRRGLTSDWRLMDEYTLPLIERLFQSHDFREGVAAYMEKRRPRFEGR